MVSRRGEARLGRFLRSFLSLDPGRGPKPRRRGGIRRGRGTLESTGQPLHPPRSRRLRAGHGPRGPLAGRGRARAARGAHGFDRPGARRPRVVPVARRAQAQRARPGSDRDLETREGGRVHHGPGIAVALRERAHRLARRGRMGEALGAAQRSGGRTRAAARRAARAHRGRAGATPAPGGLDRVAQANARARAGHPSRDLGESLGETLGALSDGGARRSGAAPRLDPSSDLLGVPRSDLAPDPNLPADTRLWALLQQASGGVWAGCVYDEAGIAAKLVREPGA